MKFTVPEKPRHFQIMITVLIYSVIILASYALSSSAKSENSLQKIPPLFQRYESPVPSFNELVQLLNGKTLETVSRVGGRSSEFEYFYIKDNIFRTMYLLDSTKDVEYLNGVVYPGENGETCFLYSESDPLTDHSGSEYCFVFKKSTPSNARDLGELKYCGENARTSRDCQFFKIHGDNLVEYHINKNIRELKNRQKKENQGILAKNRWRTYKDREKLLIEQVLNFTTTGSTEGSEARYWVANSQCEAISEDDKVNIREFNQTAFKIKEDTVFLHKDNMSILVLRWGDEKNQYSEFFLPPPLGNGVPAMERLEKAWSLMFEECPGTTSRF